MRHEVLTGFGYSQDARSPEPDGDGPGLWLAVTGLAFDPGEGVATLDAHVTLRLPLDTVLRYHSVTEALVLVGVDADGGGCFSLYTSNAALGFHFPPGERPSQNLIAPPPDPFPPPTPPAGAMGGGWVNTTLVLHVPRPHFAPSVFLHAVLEHHVSNVVGLDLLAPAAVPMGPAPAGT